MTFGPWSELRTVQPLSAHVKPWSRLVTAQYTVVAQYRDGDWVPVIVSFPAE